MHDIKALESEWRRYKKRKKRPLYWSIGSLIVLLLLGIFFFKKNFLHMHPHSNTVSIESNSHIKNNMVVLLDTKLSKLLVELPIKKKERYLENTTILNNEKRNKTNMPTLPVVNNIPIIDAVPVGKIIVSDKPKPKIDTKPMIEMKDAPHKKIHLDIVESSSVSAYSDVEKRFYQSYDTDDSLFLAKSYYRKGNYKKAEYWAFQTNKVNNSLEESWLIYVKSKYKLGHKNEAIRILTNYAKRSNASAAWNLLLKLKK